MSQRRLSEKSGIPRSTLSKIIGTDERPVDTNELESLCKALHVMPHVLVADAWNGEAFQKDYDIAAYRSDEPKGADEIFE